ncbi:MAG TPA: 23S rRNA (adenine(2503)-C(2))-methyltransferase RlmN [Candidatus Pacearchaeota archaeon]|nr:23S rRNA (adenine(2503)-C(2))-methyltransferase RlmN [Candidatus Pacearchaeota archaeon]HOK94074.1 23S rRNA (adenine(2503)-C(2))-methyltransferase RlmN [Candidatus Pacearchaeota archaeon]HPO75145.1 23S rRNA (adenine(2503)-C(2))-methyltransferase RlmN [Candidatus Pacearchaeota archaeon]
MNSQLIKKILKNEPSFRLKQIKEAVFCNLIEDWSEAKNLPLSLRKILNERYSLTIKTQTFISKNSNTIKALVTLKDGLKIETVLMRHKDKRNTVCVSSEVGCPLGCVFCATGKMGFKRNLESYEIVEQVLFFARYLKKSGRKVTNVVFMGMGEPFLNYKNVIKAIRILNDKEGLNIGARKISISTVGITEGIEKLAEENLQVNLAISLHAPENKLRSELMPINKRYPIQKVLKAVDNYILKTKRRVMFEYIMIKGINDSDKCAKNLAKLLKKPLYFLNLISYNPTGIFQSSSSKRIKKFREILEKEGISVTERYRFGRDIKSACGQLATKEK